MHANLFLTNGRMIRAIGQIGCSCSCHVKDLRDAPVVSDLDVYVHTCIYVDCSLASQILVGGIPAYFRPVGREYAFDRLNYLCYMPCRVIMLLMITVMESFFFFSEKRRERDIRFKLRCSNQFAVIIFAEIGLSQSMICWYAGKALVMVMFDSVLDAYRPTGKDIQLGQLLYVLLQRDQVIDRN